MHFLQDFRNTSRFSLVCSKNVSLKTIELYNFNSKVKANFPCESNELILGVEVLLHSFVGLALDGGEL
jgi:hypothetical protein